MSCDIHVDSRLKDLFFLHPKIRQLVSHIAKIFGTSFASDVKFYGELGHHPEIDAELCYENPGKEIYLRYHSTVGFKQGEQVYFNERSEDFRIRFQTGRLTLQEVIDFLGTKRIIGRADDFYIHKGDKHVEISQAGYNSSKLTMTLVFGSIEKTTGVTDGPWEEMDLRMQNIDITEATIDDIIYEILDYWDWPWDCWEYWGE